MDLELELRSALSHEKPPAGFADRVLASLDAAPVRTPVPHTRVWRGLAAAAVLAADRSTLSVIPCVFAYCPVRKLARDGEHNGVVIKALRNSAPSLPIRSMLGVLRNGWPVMPNSSQRKSSIRMKIMLGRDC